MLLANYSCLEMNISEFMARFIHQKHNQRILSCGSGVLSWSLVEPTTRTIRLKIKSEILMMIMILISKEYWRETRPSVKK